MWNFLKDTLYRMWDQFSIWFIHLFTPHCDECLHRGDCKNCEQLYLLLERERIERTKLIDLLTPQQVAESNVEVNYSDISKPLTWRARKEQLERDAFRKAHQPKSVDEQVDANI